MKHVDTVGSEVHGFMYGFQLQDISMFHLISVKTSPECSFPHFSPCEAIDKPAVDMRSPTQFAVVDTQLRDFTCTFLSIDAHVKHLLCSRFCAVDRTQILPEVIATRRAHH